MRARSLCHGRIAAAFLVFLLCLPGVARGQNSALLDFDGVKAQVSTVVPNLGQRLGYATVFIDFENPTSRNLTASVSIQHGWAGTKSSSTMEVELEANSTRRVEMLAPILTPQTGPSVSINCNGRSGLAGLLGNQRLNTSMLVVVPRGVASGTTQRWAADFSADAGGDYANIEVARLDRDLFSTRSEGYSTLDALVIDAACGIPDERVFSPMLAFARLGGALMIAGPGADALAESHEQLAGWKQTRFQIAEIQGVLREYRFGLGRLFISELPPFDAQALRRALISAFNARTQSWVPSATTPRMFPIIPGMSALPRRTYTLLLVLFVIVIGPVNFYVVRKMGRPALILLTVPAVALVTSAGMLAFGLFHQGLDLKAARRTLTVLDQSWQIADTGEIRTLYAGTTARGGLTPAAGTSCYPASYMSSNRRERDFLVEHTSDGVRLAGDFFPPRTQVSQVILGERTTRLKLGLESVAGGIEAENALSVDVVQLLYRSSAGDYYTVSGIPYGSKQNLEPCSAVVAQSLLSDWRSKDDHVPDTLPSGTYFAELSSNPFADDLGLELNELAGTHLVWGVLAGDAP